MKTVKVLVSELSKKALDWMVAKCEDEIPATLDTNSMEWKHYSFLWEHGGPIIDREGIDLRQVKPSKFEVIEVRHFDESRGDVIEYMPSFNRDMVKRQKPPHPLDGKWMAKPSCGSDTLVKWNKTNNLSNTALEAAMRCYVEIKFGDAVEIPSSLATKLSLDELNALWVNLGDIPTVYEGEHVDKIDEDFLHFSKGTHRETVWHWFETMNPAFSVGEIMSGTCN